MAGRTLEELQAKYPPADRDAYDHARAAAILAGELAELVHAMRSRRADTTELASKWAPHTRRSRGLKVVQRPERRMRSATFPLGH